MPPPPWPAVGFRDADRGDIYETIKNRYGLRQVLSMGEFYDIFLVFDFRDEKVGLLTRFPKMESILPQFLSIATSTGSIPGTGVQVFEYRDGEEAPAALKLLSLLLRDLPVPDGIRWRDLKSLIRISIEFGEPNLDGLCFLQWRGDVLAATTADKRSIYYSEDSMAWIACYCGIPDLLTEVSFILAYGRPFKFERADFPAGVYDRVLDFRQRYVFSATKPIYSHLDKLRGLEAQWPKAHPAYLEVCPQIRLECMSAQREHIEQWLLRNGLPLGLPTRPRDLGACARMRPSHLLGTLFPNALRPPNMCLGCDDWLLEQLGLPQDAPATLDRWLYGHGSDSHPVHPEWLRFAMDRRERARALAEQVRKMGADED